MEIRETFFLVGRSHSIWEKILKKGAWFRLKIPLSYQFSEFDCAPVTFLNAFLYLFDRTMTEPSMIQNIFQYSLDLSDRKGEIGKGGTSVDAVRQITNWLNTYSQDKKLGFTCTFLMEDEVNFIKNENIKNYINKGVGITTVCITEGMYHYILVVKIDKDYVYFFDPYYTDDKQDQDDIEYVYDKPAEYNRRVKLDWFTSHEERFYSLGKMERRKLILINK
ncbi:hypothetical protein [Brevibacillus sp. H7]|uniref:hypothetical protein n=1 Tax=Brevibacillus sp. H7 TaxID=3349138 RepID=UPI0038149233